MKPHALKITTDIIEATSAESSRYALGSVKHYPASPAHGRPAYIAATNGIIVAIVPVESAIEHADLIPREVIPQLVKHWPKPDSAGRFDENKFPEITWTEGTRVYDSPAGKQCPPPEGRYPKINDVIPAIGHEEPAAVITIDADMLQRLAAAITTHGDRKTVTLIIPAVKNPHSYHVLGMNGFGIIVAIDPHAASPLDNPTKRYAAQLAQFQATAETHNRPKP